MNRRRAMAWCAAGIAALGLASWIVWRLLPDDERDVRRVIRSVAALLSFAPDESSLVKLARPSQVSRHFSPEISIDIETPEGGSRTIEGLTDLEQAVRAAFGSLQSLQVELWDLLVTIDANRLSAKAELVIAARVNGRAPDGARQFEIRLEKLEGQWRIRKVVTVRMLG